MNPISKAAIAGNPALNALHLRNSIYVEIISIPVYSGVGYRIRQCRYCRVIRARRAISSLVIPAQPELIMLLVLSTSNLV
jgi:hypothetical protein